MRADPFANDGDMNRSWQSDKHASPRRTGRRDSLALADISTLVALLLRQRRSIGPGWQHRHLNTGLLARECLEKRHDSVFL
jgi:hypothetical protein